MKTSELTGAALDWAVAKFEGITDWDSVDLVFRDDNFCWYEPSTNWAQGGPIIERKGINLGNYAKTPAQWSAWTFAPEQATGEVQAYGTTALIAAMRCYVASKLGDEVDVPDELHP